MMLAYSPTGIDWFDNRPWRRVCVPPAAACGHYIRCDSGTILRL